MTKKNPTLINWRLNFTTSLWGILRFSMYCARIKKILDQIENLETPVTNRNLVPHLLSGFSSNLSYISITIRHTKPFPSFVKARSMLAVEEQEILHDHNKNSVTSHNDHYSSPQVLAIDGTFQHSYHGGNSSRGNNRGGRNRGSGLPTYRSLANSLGWAYGWYHINPATVTSQHYYRGLLPSPNSSAQHVSPSLNNATNQAHYFFGPPTAQPQPNMYFSLHKQPNNNHLAMISPQFFQKFSIQCRL